MKKTGRKSSYETKIKPRFKEIAAWCRDGLTDIQIAERLYIHPSTLWKHKAENEEFSEILKKNKEIIDAEVENSLLKRAMGFDYIEETIEYLPDKDGNFTKILKKKVTTKMVIPDTTAQIFWLKNRQHEKWRDRKHSEISGEITMSHDDWIKRLNDAKKLITD